jgi:AraC-like DNA-binding protein
MQTGKELTATAQQFADSAGLKPRKKTAQDDANLRATPWVNFKDVETGRGPARGTPAPNAFSDFLKDRVCIERIEDVRLDLPRADDLRVVIRQQGFRVKTLAAHIGLDVRTLQRRFGEQFRTTPKTWIMRERMSLAPPLLAEGLSNKQVAASLNYTCESNFCRDFKRYFGRAPQKFARHWRFISA